MVDKVQMSTPNTVTRYDAVPLRGKARRDDWGNYHVPLTLVTPGVYPYRQHDGTTAYELKPEDEVYAPRFVESLQGSAFTDGHPPFAVTPANAKEFGCGHIKETVSRGDTGLEGEILANDPTIIGKMDRREVTQASIGLDCTIDPTPGIWTAPDGTRHAYTRIQRAMVANHVAGVAKARVPTANLRLDSAEMIVEPTERAEPMTTPSLMRLDVGDNASVEVPADVGHTIKSYIGTLITAGRKVTEDLDKQTARADAAEESLNEVNEKLETANAVDVDQLVQERTVCLAGARKLMKTDAVDSLVKDRKSNDEIRKAACLAAKPDFKLDVRNESYIESRFDHLVELANVAPANTQAAEVAHMANAPAPEAKQTLQQRYDAEEKALNDAWKVKAS